MRSGILHPELDCMCMTCVLYHCTMRSCCYVPRTVAPASHACLHVITARSCSCYTPRTLAFLHTELDCMRITCMLHHCAMCCSICIACVTAGVHRVRVQLLHLMRFAIVHPKPDAFTSWRMHCGCDALLRFGAKPCGLC